jgi:hypothetical protein
MSMDAVQDPPRETQEQSAPAAPSAEAVWSKIAASSMDAVAIKCEVCGSEIRLSHETCAGCGRLVTSLDKALLQVKLVGPDHVAYERGRRVRSAANWIGYLAIMLMLGAGIEFVSTKIDADDALDKLASLTPDETLAPVDGVIYTVPELRSQLEREPFVVLGAGLVLAAIMGGLWLWARRAPLPAIACAIALFVVVVIVSAVLDPTNILKGILVKIFAMLALGKGLKAALAARAASKTPA